MRIAPGTNFIWVNLLQVGSAVDILKFSFPFITAMIYISLFIFLYDFLFFLLAVSVFHAQVIKLSLYQLDTQFFSREWEEERSLSSNTISSSNNHGNFSLSY